MRPYSAPAAATTKNIKMLNLYEISSHRLTENDWIQDYELETFFFHQNPWWIQEGYPPLVPDAERTQCLTELQKELPQGYALNGSSIEVKDASLYWNRVKAHLASLAKSSATEDFSDGMPPLSWWKEEVDGIHGTLIYFRDTEELLTLNEFLLYMMYHGEEYPYLYVGGIFELEV